MQSKELYHHGIIGQKWGVRRTPAQLGHKTSHTKESSSNPKKAHKRSSKSSTSHSSSHPKRTIESARQFVNTLSKKKVAKLTGNAATIASAALWIGSAAVGATPVGALLNTAAAVSNAYASYTSIKY